MYLGGLLKRKFNTEQVISTNPPPLPAPLNPTPSFYNHPPTEDLKLSHTFICSKLSFLPNVKRLTVSTALMIKYAITSQTLYLWEIISNKCIKFYCKIFDTTYKWNRTYYTYIDNQCKWTHGRQFGPHKFPG